MLTLLERSVARIDDRLVLLAPIGTSVPPSLQNVAIDSERRARLVRELQRLRGAVYVEDGAVQSHQLSADGLHQTQEDEKSWHLLFLNALGGISSCIWYLEHSGTTIFEHLRLRHCALNRVDPWRDRLRTAIDSELDEARQSGIKYAEVGGWAVAKENRCTSEGLLLALGAYSLSRVLGNALVVTTATVRHSSSTILRRLGGFHLKADGLPIPPYYDPSYECDIELLRFDSRRPSQKYVGLIDRLADKLASVLVIATPSVPDWARFDDMTVEHAVGVSV